MSENEKTTVQARVSQPDEYRPEARNQLLFLSAQFLLGMAVNLIGRPLQTTRAAHAVSTVAARAPRRGRDRPGRRGRHDHPGRPRRREPAASARTLQHQHAHSSINRKRSIVKFRVLGATGRTGVLFIKKALDQGHQVTALVRRADAAVDPRTRILSGDVTDATVIASAARGHDAIISTLGVSPFHPGCSGLVTV